MPLHPPLSSYNKGLIYLEHTMQCPILLHKSQDLAKRQMCVLWQHARMCGKSGTLLGTRIAAVYAQKKPHCNFSTQLLHEIKMNGQTDAQSFCFRNRAKLALNDKVFSYLFFFTATRLGRGKSRHF